MYYYGEIGIRGVLANEILADKISVLSKQIMFRRSKDIIDVYALAHCVKVQTPEIFEIYKRNPSREVGSFDEFYTRRQDVEHAYMKLKGIDGKPDFDDVYSYLVQFVQPFAIKDGTPRLWNSKLQVWQDFCQDLDTRKHSVLEEIRADKTKQQESSPNKDYRPRGKKGPQL